MPDDFSSSTSTTGRVALGTPASGSIETTGDTDWFAVTLEANTRYQIAVDGLTLFDPTVTLYNAAGTRVGFDDDSGPGLNSLLLYTPSNTGTYYVSAAGYGFSSGSYRVSVAVAAPEDDYAASTATTGRVPVGGSAAGRINFTGDVDWFAVSLTSGQQYSFTLNGTTLASPALALLNGAGTQLATNSSLINFTAPSTGTFYLAASAAGTGAYTVSAAVQDDYAANSGTTGRVAVGGTATGRIETASDADWFAVSLTAGQTYRFALDGGTLLDPYLTLYSGAGTRLASDDDSGPGLNALLTYTANSTGTFYLAASGFAGTGSYTLSAASGGSGDDYAGSAATAGRVNVGGSATGTIETPTDTDWFAVTLTAGQRYEFALDGGTLFDPFLILYSAGGSKLAYDDDSGAGFNALLAYTPTASGTYYLAASSALYGTGSYTLRAGTATINDDYAASTATTGRVAVGASVTGSVETSGDNDWFAVTLSAGTRYQFALNGVSLTDPMLSLYSSSGTLITSDDDSGPGLNSLLTYTPAASGTYYLGARGYGTATGTYQLAASAQAAVTDDYAAGAGTTGRVSAGASATGRIETLGDHDWFAVTLTAGTTYEFALNGSGLADPFLTLRSSSGSKLASDDDSGSGFNALLRYTATASGTYYLDVSAVGAGTGAYTLAATTAAATVPSTAPGPAPSPPAPAPGPAPGPAPSGGSFNIEIVFSGDSTYRSYFDAAAARWEQVITGDLADVRTTQQGLIDDLRINASVTAIDGSGGVLGRAAPTQFRTDADGLPYLGIMEFDSADLARMAANGTLTDVILHEMGHVLGIGTLWQSHHLVAGSSYIGANAVAAYAGLLHASATSVPLETGGGAGTRNAHWSESGLDRELMTGYAESAPPMPLSVVTIGSLADLGYTVNYNAASAYTL